MRRRALTKRLLEAMGEALDFRLAGELGDESCPERDYQDALDWVHEQLGKRGDPQ
jgi:hypothetical protein